MARGKRKVYLFLEGKKGRRRMLFAGILVVDLAISRQDQFEETMVCVCVCNLGIEKRERIFAFSGLFKNKNDFRKEDCLFSFYFCIMNYWSLRTMCVFVHWRCICEIHLDFMRYSRIC